MLLPVRRLQILYGAHHLAPSIGLAALAELEPAHRPIVCCRAKTVDEDPCHRQNIVAIVSQHEMCPRSFPGDTNPTLGMLALLQVNRPNLGSCASCRRNICRRAARSQMLGTPDDDGVRGVLQNILRAAGHDVAAHGSGRAALAAADTTTFDLVLTDVLMPDVDGVEILRNIIRREPRPRVIVMTGGSHMLGMDFLAIAPALGADGVISKPIRAKELVATVAAVLGTAPAAPAPERRAVRSRSRPGR